jgi:hypothetical protein
MAAQTPVSITCYKGRGPMTAHPYATYLRAALVLTLVLTGGAFVIATAQDQPKETLTADEAIACIQTAVAAQAGFIKEVEGDEDGGKRLCEVKIVDQTGKRHTLHIDVQTKQVVKTK